MGYKKRKGVTRDYSGLQQVTGGYKGLQGVARGDRGTPLEKSQFCGCLKPMFSLFAKACLQYKTFKIVFL